MYSRAEEMVIVNGTHKSVMNSIMCIRKVLSISDSHAYISHVLCLTKHKSLQYVQSMAEGRMCIEDFLYILLKIFDMNGCIQMICAW